MRFGKIGKSLFYPIYMKTDLITILSVFLKVIVFQSCCFSFYQKTIKYFSDKVLIFENIIIERPLKLKTRILKGPYENIIIFGPIPVTYFTKTVKANIP